MTRNDDDGDGVLVAATYLDREGRPGGMDAKVDLGPGPMPGEELARFIVLEILVHAWDLAVATGQDPDLPTDLVSLASEVARDMVGPERTGGRFAPPVSVSEDADEATRLLSYLGRRPWPRSPS